MNAHTKLEPDFIENDANNNNLYLPNNYVADKPMHRRNSDERAVDDHAKALLDLCMSSGLKILNGRKIGDMFGACTYYGPMCKNPTLIDYGLAHIDNFSSVTYFKVQDFCYLSDHCLIHAYIVVNPKRSKNSIAHVTKLLDIPKRYIWEEDRESLFLSNLQSKQSQKVIEDILEKDYEFNQSGADNITEAVTDIFKNAAEKTFRKSKTFSVDSKPKTIKRAKHFDKDCISLLKQLKAMSKTLSKDPKNAELRKTFYFNKRHFKTVVKHKLLMEKETLINKLSSKTNNPKEFWKLLDKVQQCANGKHKDDNDVSPAIWEHHFKNLMCKPMSIQNDHQNHILEFIKTKENWCTFNELSFKISDLEINAAIKRLKKGKACGEDMVSNEMLKSSIVSIITVLNKLFNFILSTGQYPTMWCGSWLKPLHKGGDTRDPNRYRGISIMSCMGKLFCSILNTRLVKFLKDRNFNSEFQNGFSENCKTSDHILTLKTLTDKYFQENKKLFACFIDYKKAFDSVWRDALIYKLLKADGGGIFGKIIQNMYEKTSVQIKLNNGLTEGFQDNIGVKQGCVLSPTLFKLFVNDLPDIFDETCKPAKLFNKKVSCLMFADDVVLVSETKEGLQHSLNELKKYSDKWQLQVNSEKSKIMTFNKSGKICKERFNLGNEVLENVKTYNYLGVTLTPNCLFNQAVSNLDKKARKAMFKVRNSLFSANFSPKTSLQIYDTLVRPINTYCADVWGTFLKNTAKMFDIMSDKYKMFDEHCFEKTDLRFCKSILGVHRKACNAAVRGELGRYPTAIFILKQVFKNWLRIADKDKDSLLYDVYLCNAQMVYENKNCWLSNVRKLVIDTLGLKHLWDNQGQQLYPKSQIINAVSNLKHLFEFHWRNEINKCPDANQNSGNKLKTYSTFKKNFDYEQYLDFNRDFKKRRSITKLRISAHRLEIEIGRYRTKTSNRIKREERTCKLCSTGCIEDEEHVLMTCPKYDIYRKIMLDNLYEAFPGLNRLDKKEQFIFIIRSIDYEVFQSLSTMLDSVIRIRGNI